MTTEAYSTTMVGQKKVGGGGPPLGVSIRRPPKVGNGVLNSKSTSPTSNTRHQHRWPCCKCLREFRVSPLYISPRGSPVHRKPAAKKRKSLVFSHFWSIFSPSETRFKNDYEKTSKKMRKSWILASQNPAQTHPNSLPNRRSKKNGVFSCIFRINSTYFLPRFS